jgi:hypothetical protein
MQTQMQMGSGDEEKESMRGEGGISIVWVGGVNVVG